MTTPHVDREYKPSDFSDGFVGEIAPAVVAEPFAVLAFGGEAVDLPGLAEQAAAAAVFRALAFFCNRAMSDLFTA